MGKGWPPKANSLVSDLRSLKVGTAGLSGTFSQEVMCEICVLPIKAQPNSKLQHMLLQVLLIFQRSS